MLCACSKCCSPSADLECIPNAKMISSSKCTPLAALEPEGAKDGGDEGGREGGGFCWGV